MKAPTPLRRPAPPPPHALLRTAKAGVLVGPATLHVKHHRWHPSKSGGCYHADATCLNCGTKRRDLPRPCKVRPKAGKIHGCGQGVPCGHFFPCPIRQKGERLKDWLDRRDHAQCNRTPREEAEAMADAVACGMTQSDIAAATSQSRRTVAYRLALFDTRPVKGPAPKCPIHGCTYAGVHGGPHSNQDAHRLVGSVFGRPSCGCGTAWPDMDALNEHLSQVARALGVAS